MTTDPDPTPSLVRPQAKPGPLVIVVLLLAVLGLAAAIWSQMARSAVDADPGGQPSAASTSRQEAEQRARGNGPEGSNPSQDSYTSQNQSRPPPAR